MFNRGNVRPSKSLSIGRIFMGIIFIFIGVTKVIIMASKFGEIDVFNVCWTLGAVVFTGFNIHNVFSKKGFSEERFYEERNMKAKTSRTLKKVLTLIAICLWVGGMAGFFAPFVRAKVGGAAVIGKYYEQHPLNDKSGIVVDSNGNIYIGEKETGSIQVYDSGGNFQYGFTAPHLSNFGIEQDKIHVITAKMEISYFVFYSGELVSSEKGIKSSREEELIKQYNMDQDNSYVTSNKIYKISSFNTVRIQDKESGQVEKIHLNAPIFPLPIFVYWLIGAAGMGLFWVLYPKSSPLRRNRMKAKYDAKIKKLLSDN